MGEALPSRIDAIAALTATGADYELEEKTINGSPCRAFLHAPATIRDLLIHAGQFGDLNYLVYEEERLTYEQTAREVARIATLLKQTYGVSKGDRVAIAMRNYPEWATSFLAITSLGAIAVALNALWSGEELVYGIELTTSKVLIADRERIERLHEHMASLKPRILSVRCDEYSNDRITPLTESATTTDLPTDLPTTNIDPDDDAIIMFTSGSTGHPKGAVSSHRAAVHAIMSWDLDVAVALWRNKAQRPGEPWEIQFKFMVGVPLFHVSGSHVGMLQCLLRGRCMYLSYRWDAVLALETIEREQITHFIAVPAITGDLVRAAEAHQGSLASLLTVGGGGSPRPSQQVRDIDRVFGNAAPGTGWGMTETNAIGAGIAGADYLRRPLSSGQCSAVLDMRILDDGDRELARGERGHLVIRGTSMFREYWNRPDANAAAFVDGWFRTGDIALIDEEGFLYIVDRAKDIVIRGGENIGCGEVEDAIFAHPGVREAAVFGLPHARLGEELAAIIVPRAGNPLDEEEIVLHLSKQLAAFQIPSRLLFSREPLPRIASGKFNKRAIRLATMNSLGLTED